MLLLSCGRGPFHGPFHDPCRGHLHQGKHRSACRSGPPFLCERPHKTCSLMQYTLFTS